MRTVYISEDGNRFDSEEECLEYEKNGNAYYTTLTCSKCGKTKRYTVREYFNDGGIDSLLYEFHELSAGRPGYGSKLDGCDVDFCLCDDCLSELVGSFTNEGKEKIYNSGSNYYAKEEE